MECVKSIVRAGAWLVVVVPFLHVPGAAAVTVTPMVVDMETVGRRAVARLRVVNTWANPVPVEVTVERVELDEEGEPRTAPAEEDFLVFPPLALIPPGRTQIFRIQYLGDPDLDRSRSYIFNTRQVPVELPEDTSAIQILFNFRVVVSVAPPGAEPDLAVVAAEPVTDESDGRIVVRLTVENRGDGHGYLSRTELRLRYFDETSGAEIWQRAFTAEEMRRIVGVGLLQPGKRRRFLLPIELPRPGGRLEADLVHADR